tara:strand:+ start:543 stop:854 length:312 start_codon:yes stop_codon:yes gene_type:complete
MNRICHHEFITALSSSTATGLTRPQNSDNEDIPIILTHLQPETQDIRVRIDGTDPTSSVGILVEKKETKPFDCSPDKIKIIATSGSDGAVNVTYHEPILTNYE